MEGQIEKHIECCGESMEAGAQNTFMHGIVVLNQIAKSKNPQRPSCFPILEIHWENQLFYKSCTLKISLLYNFCICTSEMFHFLLKGT